jgi:hypothetical protein
MSILRLTFPDYRHFPALFRKLYLQELVAFPVSVQLGSPEVDTGFRHPTTGTTQVAMPETAVYKYQLSPLAEDKVWPTWDVGRVQSVSIPKGKD